MHLGFFYPWLSLDFQNPPAALFAWTSAWYTALFSLMHEISHLFNASIKLAVRAGSTNDCKSDYGQVTLLYKLLVKRERGVENGMIFEATIDGKFQTSQNVYKK